VSDLSDLLQSKWPLRSLTREAFVTQIANRLDALGARGEELYDVFRVPGTALVNDASCMARLDEAFAYVVIDEAHAILVRSRLPSAPSNDNE